MLEMLLPLSGYILVYLVGAFSPTFATDDHDYEKWLLWVLLPALLFCIFGFLAYTAGFIVLAIAFPYGGFAWLVFEYATRPYAEPDDVDVSLDPGEEDLADALTAMDIADGDTPLEAERLRVLARAGNHIRLVESD